MNTSTSEAPGAITSGIGGAAMLVLTAPDGARAEIYLHGANVASWVPASGREQLFLSPIALFQPGVTVHGGIPVVFPQFADLGSLPMHGFARDFPWTFEGAHLDGAQAVASFSLRDFEATRMLWPHPFLAELTVVLGGEELAVTLAITNTGPAPFTFTAALHSYFAVADVETAAVEGLAGLRRFDKAAGGVAGHAPDAPLRFPGKVDAIHFDVPGPLRLVTPERTLMIRMAGFPDAVVWNPGPPQNPVGDDLDPLPYRRFVCVEAACIGVPVRLGAGERWQGTQMIQAYEQRWERDLQEQPREEDEPATLRESSITYDVITEAPAPQIVIDPSLHNRVEEAAREHKVGIDRILNEAIRRYLWELDRRKISEESQVYQRRHAELKAQYLGQYVAMHNGQVVDHDKDFAVLRQRVRQQFQHTPVMITLVEEVPQQSVTRHGLRLEATEL